MCDVVMHIVFLKIKNFCGELLHKLGFYFTFSEWFLFGYVCGHDIPDQVSFSVQVFNPNMPIGKVMTSTRK